MGVGVGVGEGDEIEAGQARFKLFVLKLGFSYFRRWVSGRKRVRIGPRVTFCAESDFLIRTVIQIHLCIPLSSLYLFYS